MWYNSSCVCGEVEYSVVRDGYIGLYGRGSVGLLRIRLSARAFGLDPVLVLENRVSRVASVPVDTHEWARWPGETSWNTRVTNNCDDDDDDDYVLSTAVRIILYFQFSSSTILFITDTREPFNFTDPLLVVRRAPLPSYHLPSPSHRLSSFLYRTPPPSHNH